MMSLPEDLRVSKILKRLATEENEKNALELCIKLDKAVRSKVNAVYIFQAFDYLYEIMIIALLQSPKECHESISSTLGVMGYIKRNDFNVYKVSLLKSYKENYGLRKYLMIALKTTLR